MGGSEPSDDRIKAEADSGSSDDGDEESDTPLLGENIFLTGVQNLYRGEDH